MLYSLHAICSISFRLMVLSTEGIRLDANIAKPRPAIRLASLL